MRVGLFTESYDPVLNGVSTSVKTLAREMRGAGHEPVVVAPRYPGFADDEAASGVAVRRIPAFRTVFNPQNPFAWPLAYPIPPALRDLALDVVHTQQPFGIGQHGRAAARRRGVPHVSTFHTLYTEYVHYFPLLPPALLVRGVRRHLRRFYNSCDAVITPSGETARWLEAVGVRPDRLAVVPTGIPDPPPRDAAAVEAVRRRFDLPPCAPVLLFVGRLAVEKNLDLLVEAFAGLCRDGAGVSPERLPVLLVAGGGPYADGLRRKVEASGVADRTRLAGPIPREQLDPVYGAATLFVFPSSTETQGVVLSEAQSHGLPCVAVRGGGAAEFVRDGVDALVTAPEPGAFTAAIRSLLDDEERRRRFAAAAQANPLRPSPAGMARSVIAVYEAARAAR